MTSKWTNLSLGGRLAVSFAVPAVLLAVMGLVGERAASRIYTNVETVASVRLPIVVNLLEADRDLHQALVAERSLVLGRATGEAAAKLRKDMADNHAQADERIGKAAALAVSPEERTLVTAFEAARVEWRADLARVLEHVDAGRFDEAAALSLGSVGKKFDAMREHVNKLEEVSETLAGEARREGASRHARTRVELLVVTLLGLAGAALLGWSVTRWVARRVKHSAQTIDQSAAAVASAACELAGSAQTLSTGATEQAASLEETSASMEELAAMTRQNAEHTTKAAASMVDTERSVVAANTALEAMTTAMSAIRDSSAQVGRIIKTIDEIAFQTNILALNAAVEAARAGEAGLGFAVVADEVRALAQRAAQAARDTTALIEQSIGRSAEGHSRAEAVAAVIGDLTTSTGHVKSLIDEISLASRQQSQGLQQVAVALAEIERVTQSTAASAEEGAAASEELRANALSARVVVQDLIALAGGAPAEVAEQTATVATPRAFAKAAAIVLAAVLGSAAPASAQGLERWVEVQTLTVAARYRVVENSAGMVTANQAQENNAIKARVKADQRGRLTVNFGAFTGNSLTSSWNSTGVGTGDGTLQLSVKQLYVAAVPVKGVEAQFGSLYAVRGESTEITSYDNDTYLTGERVSVKRPRQFFFDEISLTHAYLGDVSTPNVFERLDRVADSNYRQVLLGKKIGPRLAVSADWTDTMNRTTWRGAVAVKLPRVVDAVRAEYYVRDSREASGAAVTVERKLARGIVASGGYASIDRDMGGLNGDRYNRGRRVFAGAAIPVVGPLSASLFYTHAVDNDFSVSVARRFDAIVTYNVLAAFQKPKAR